MYLVKNRWTWEAHRSGFYNGMSGPILLALRIILVGVLYAFMGWALWILWHDLLQQSKMVQNAQVHPLTLTLQGEGQPAVYRFTSAEAIIGRDPACDCHLDDPAVSARHSRLSFHHGQWWVEDMLSKNGTLLNQAPVTKATVVISGDRLQCGRFIFDIDILEEK